MRVRKPFSEDQYALGRCKLQPLGATDALIIAETLSRMSPWRDLGYYAQDLSKFLLNSDPLFRRYTIMRYTIMGSGERVGAVCVRHPWLKGTYLELLGIFEPFQGMGVGREIISWMELQTRPAANNIWALVSSFNNRGREFYRKNGFTEIAVLNNLVKPGFDEILIRKMLD